MRRKDEGSLSLSLSLLLLLWDVRSVVDVSRRRRNWLPSLLPVSVIALRSQTRLTSPGIPVHPCWTLLRGSWSIILFQPPHQHHS
jgi:hypothetical protein